MHVGTLHCKELAAVRDSPELQQLLSVLLETFFSPPGSPSQKAGCLSCSHL